MLDAAYRVFSRRGIAASSLAQVAEEAGLTKGAIYSSFAGKDDLVLALLDHNAMQRLDSALAGFTEATVQGETQDGALRAVGRVLVEAMRSEAGAHRLLAENYAMSYHDPVRRRALRERRRESRATISRAVAGLQETLGLRLRLSPDETAVVLLALSNGLGVEGDIDPDAVPDDLLGRVLGPLLVDPPPSDSSSDVPAEPGSR